MPGFDLVPVDGGDPIHLPPGETVLGRGPFLGVSDKRVSRHHGILENLNRKLLLKPTHMNPCFVQSSLSDNPLPLQRDAWHPLHHGDLLSLLPGQFIYKVVAVGEGDPIPRNSEMVEEAEESPVSPKPDVEVPLPCGQDYGLPPPHKKSTAAALEKRDSAKIKEIERDLTDVTSVPKRRVLPPWMIVAAAAQTCSLSSKKVESAVKRNKGAAASTSTQQAAAKQAVPTCSPEEMGPFEEEIPKKRRKMSDGKTQFETDVCSKQPAILLQSKSNRSDVRNKSHSFTMDAAGGRGGGTVDVITTKQTHDIRQPKDEDKNSENEHEMSVGSNNGPACGSIPSKPQFRTPCPYGKDCYRKNPVHFQECCHPGDADYEAEDDTEEVDPPECPYGTDCYRKNPLHRKEFKHTKRPASTRCTIPKKTSADDEDENEYFGDNNSFINDDSDDVGDSDYVPPASDDSDKEDIKGLQKEAKAFLKRRK